MAALLEATVGVGVVFPGVVLMFLAGAYAAEGDASLAAVFLFALAGTIIGDTWSYGLGRWGSRWLAGGRFASSLRLGEALASGQTRWLIPFYHLHSATRAVGPFGSGALRLPLRLWLPLDYLGAVIANVAWVGSGALIGQAVLTERGTLEPNPLLRIGLAMLAGAWLLVAHGALTRRLRSLRAEQAGEAAPDRERADAELPEPERTDSKR